MIDINVLKGLGAIKKYKKGEYIFRQGDPGSEMYIVLAGKVHLLMDSPDDSTVKTAEMAPGEFFGEMSILEDLPRSASALADITTVVLSINKINFELFIEKQPSMAYKLMKGLSLRIRNLNEEVKCLNEEIKKKCNNVEDSNTPKNSAQLSNLLFPPGHKLYNITAPESHNSYLFEKKVKCPVCETNFNVNMFRVTKLRIDSQDKDFRKRYKDFEPLWYTLWVCPNCLYSSYYFDFESFPDSSSRVLIEKTKELKGEVLMEFSSPRNIDQVFTSYYLALYCSDIYSTDHLKPAKLWLQLSWLYNDVKDDEMFKKASLSALESYHNAYYNQTLDISTQDEQQLCLVLGELFLIKGDAKEAADHFRKAINNRSGTQRLNQQAQDRIQDIKSNYRTGS